MTIRLSAEADGAVIAGEPARFRLVLVSDTGLPAGTRLRLLHDYRGSAGKETLGQVDDPTGANFVAGRSAQVAPIRLRTYSAAHSYKPPWTAEPECYRWVDLFGSEVSLNCHVVEATFDGGLAAGDALTLRFGANERGFLLTRKSYRRFPIWAIVDEAGDGAWRAGGSAEITVCPSAPARVLVTIPSISVRGETIQAVARVFDAHLNPVQDRLELPLEAPPGLVRDPAGSGWKSVAVGVHRLSGRTAEGLEFRSNPMLAGERPLRRRLYWGDLHGHCNVCDGGVRTPTEYYAWARDDVVLDFCALTAHDFGIALGAAAGRWDRLKAVAAEFNQPGRFATLLGWEATHAGLPLGQAVGHKNILFRGGDAPFFNGSTYGTPRVRVDYCDYAGLRTLLKGLDCLVIPHHPLNPVTPGGLGTNWNAFWAARERVVEIHSLWGTSEGMDSPGRPVDAVEGTSVLTALMRGYRLGFVGGSDTHDGRPGNPLEPWAARAAVGLTAVWAPRMTREAIYDAIQQRRCYATTGARIILETHVGGLSMGQQRPVAAGDPLLAQREVKVFVAGTAGIRKVEIVRNGQVIHTLAGNGDMLSGVWTDRSPLGAVAMTDNGGGRFVFYYVRVQQEDGNWAWASPVWLRLKDESRD